MKNSPVIFYLSVWYLCIPPKEFSNAFEILSMALVPLRAPRNIVMVRFPLRLMKMIRFFLTLNRNGQIPCKIE